MDNNQEVFNQSPNSRKTFFNTIGKSVFFFLLFTLGCVITLLLLTFLTSINFKNSTVEEQKNELSQIKNAQTLDEDTTVKEGINQVSWSFPISKKQGFPLVGNREYDHTLKVYSVTDGKVLNAGITYKGYSGATGFGESTPAVSPDFLYTAYIGENGRLNILNHETLKSFEVPNSSQVEYITGWMKDSNRIIYYIHPLDNIESVTQGMGGTPNEYKFTKTSRLGGFYIFNIQTGENISLYPINNIEVIVSNNSILCKDITTKDKMILFNVDTFVADFTSVKDNFGYGVDNFDISKNLKYWTFLYSKNRDTSSSSVVYSPFPKLDGVTIASGSWAEFQRPKISPDGSKISFIHRDGWVKSGEPHFVVNVYDIKTKQIKKYSEAYDSDWLSNNLLLLPVQYKTENNKLAHKYNLLDLNTGNIKEIIIPK